MEETNRFVVFGLDDRKFALHLSNVQRVVRIVEITPLLKAPEYIKGIINFQGRFIPVVDVRKLFCLPEKEIDLNDQLIIANTSRRSVALWVDSAGDVIEKTAGEVISAEEIFFGIDYVESVFRFDDDIVLLHDLDRFMTRGEISLLNSAIKNHQAETKPESSSLKTALNQPKAKRNLKDAKDKD